MHVVILNQYALPKGAAGITRHGEIGAELVRRGHAVTVLASAFNYLRRSESRKADSVEHGVQFKWLRTGTYASNDSRRVLSFVRYSVAAVIAARRLRPQPDVIIGSSPQILAGLSAAIVARWIRVPWVLEVRDFWPSVLVDLGAVRDGSVLHQVLVGLERWLYRHSARTICVPPRGALRLAELGADPRRCVHIPNAATAFDSRESIERASVPNPLDPGEFVIVYTGAHGVANRLENVIAGAEVLRSRHPEIYARLRIVLVGDGQQRASITRMAQDRNLGRVQIVGPVEKQEIPRVLAQSDACLLHVAPAGVFRYGLSPNKLFDYFAAGKPVLISSDYPTLVDEAGAGIRFPPGDPGALADAIVEMVNTPEADRVKMGARGRRLVETEYSIEAVTDRYEALLREVVSER